MLKTTLENVELLDLLITAVVIPLMPLLLKWLNAKIKNDNLREIAFQVEDAALAAVKSVYQTYIEELKFKRADGKLTDDEKAEAKDRALDHAKEIMGPEARKLALKLFKNNGFEVNKLIRHKIEAAVHDLKKS